jgi:hypothetical protein
MPSGNVIGSSQNARGLKDRSLSRVFGSEADAVDLYSCGTAGESEDFNRTPALLIKVSRRIQREAERSRDYDAEKYPQSRPVPSCPTDSHGCS